MRTMASEALLSILLKCLTVSLILSLVALTAQVKGTAPSAEVQEKIQKALAAAPKNSVIVFDSQGNNLNKGVTLTEDQLRTYDSLKSYVRKNSSEVDGCNNPTPVPPPPCVLCDNGRIVCTNAKFRGNQAK